MTGEIGSLIIDLEGLTVTAEEREILAHPLVGGVILFARNYASREQLITLCQQIRLSCQHPLLITVDQEGGRVQRFIHEFTRIPFMGIFGKWYDQDPATASRLVQDCGWLMAMELLSAGIDLSLAPVLDLDKGVSTIIGQRAFHAHPQTVIAMANAFVNGMNEAGMASIGKHFPGHGAVIADSHLTIPIDERSIHEIEHDDMLPFAEMIKNGILAIMAAHIVFPQVDDLPVGFSSYWLKTVLRDRLGFTGAIFSDDLNMEGANLSANYSDRVMMAREAGCDFTLLCNNRMGVIHALDNLAFALNKVDREKWRALQGNFSSVQNQSYRENQRWVETREILHNLNKHNNLEIT